MKYRHTLIIAALALLIALPAAAQSQDLWIHVKVHEDGGENTRVTVNLPVSFIEGVMPMLEESGHMDDARLEFDDSDVTVDDLRRVLQSLKDSPDATFAEVQTDTETVAFYKQGDYLRVETEESLDGATAKTEVQARFPIAVLDALLSAPGERLDIRAAVQALAAHGPGELVTVRDGATSVRVWIDEYAEAE